MTKHLRTKTTKTKVFAGDLLERSDGRTFRLDSYMGGDSIRVVPVNPTPAEGKGRQYATLNEFFLEVA